MTGSAITLGDMQAKGMTMLEVACRKCDRRGRLSIAHDCPRMQKPQASVYELCGVMFPELPGWF